MINLIREIEKNRKCKVFRRFSKKWNIGTLEYWKIGFDTIYGLGVGYRVNR
jgi:hypothetical protein